MNNSDKQNTSFWDTDESIDRYAKMSYELSSVESTFILNATTLTKKNISKIKVLDLGCGGGRTTIPLYKMGYDIYGLDISPNLINALKKTIPTERAILGDATVLPFANDTFDIVIFSHNSIDCIYPYESRTKAIKEISRVLTNGGYFIFSTHEIGVIPYNLTVLKNIARNIKSVTRSILGKSGYYKEKMQNGHIVDLYYTNIQNTEVELTKESLTIIDHSKNTSTARNNIKKYIESVISWERYYLAKKII